MTGITVCKVQGAVTPKAGNSELWFFWPAHHVMVISICIMFQENIYNSFQITERTHILQKSLFSMFKGHNSKSRLWFLCSARRLIVLYICVRFHANISNCIQLAERTTSWSKWLCSMFKGQ